MITHYCEYLHIFKIYFTVMNSFSFLFLIYSFLVVFFVICIFILVYFLIYIIYIFIFLPSNLEFKIFKYIGNYVRKIFAGISHHFPVQFINKYSIKSDKKYLYIFIPHGLLTISQIVHILDPNSPLKFLNMYNAAHSFVFKIPILRELALMMGIIPVEKAHIKNYLKESSVSITVGGKKEVSYALDNEVNDKLFIKNRKGFIRIAKDAHIEIVPIYCWNEQQILTFKPTENLQILGEILSKIIGRTFEINLIQIFLPDKLLTLFNALLGKISAVKLFVGTPINIDGLTVDEAHSFYLKKIKELFSYAAKSENSDKQLIIE